MSTAIELLALGGAAAAAGVGALLQWPGRQRGPVSTPMPPASPIDTSPWPEPTLPVLGFETLIEETGTAGLINRCRADAGLNAATWDELVVPVMRNVAELVQLLPASEAHHHAQPGGLWIHTCETLALAIRYRAAFVLPAATEADEVARAKHAWTAGVIIGALLHDVGKVATDVRVRLYGPGIERVSWSAMAGSMRAAGASAYAVHFPLETERDYRAHQRLGGVLLQRLVPPATLLWISSDARLFKVLVQYLMNEVEANSGADDNPIAHIVSHAEVESVRANLLNGPRTRFASAQVVPLIERLMAALRRMLAEGGHLPLNRPGAAGYVFEGELWFAAARLANTVRDYLAQHESSAGIPGEDKNDRLFDAWQDYGACRTNTASGRALFGGRIEFDAADVAGYALPAMLRFPLDRLYRTPGDYPAPMRGRIVAIEAGTARAAAAEPKAAPVATPPEKVNQASQPNAEAAIASEPAIGTPAKTYLDAEDAASTAQFSPAPVATPNVIAPVAPSLPLPDATDKAIPEAAIRFMRWLQTGIASGSLGYNSTGAMVHFVRWDGAVALLLVSPVIFKSFEEAEGETGANPGLATQRAFTAAGWHLRGANGRNIWSYQILRGGNKGGKLLNGFLVEDPARFFAPVPPPNERLIAWTRPADAGKGETT